MHRSRPTRAATIALLVLASGVLAGCSPFGDDQPAQQTAQDRSGRLLTAVEVKTALPSQASLPVGWSSAARNVLRPTNTHSRFSPARCQPLDHGLDLGYLRAKVRSYRTFVKPDQAVLGVGIGSHPTHPPSLDAVTEALRTCKTFTTVEGKSATRVVAKQLRVPYLAEGTVSARFVMRRGAETMTYDVIRIPVGHNQIQADMITLGGHRPGTKVLVTVARNALLNLS